MNNEPPLDIRRISLQEMLQFLASLHGAGTLNGSLEKCIAEIEANERRKTFTLIVNNGKTPEYPRQKGIKPL